MIIIGIMLLIGSPLYAGISILTPVAGKTSPSRILLLVVKGPVGSVVKLRVQNPSSKWVLSKAVSKGKEAVYHFRLTLVRGKNVFWILPGETRLNVSWNPAFSIARPERFPGIYLFHEKKAEAACLPCHKALRKDSRAPSGKRGCLPCHRQEVIPPKNAWVHGPAAEGNCGACHASKASATGVRFTPIMGGSDKLCFRCHVSERRWKSRAYLHGPVGAGNCVFCHDPHSSPRKFYLRYDGSQGLCLVCHLKKARNFSKKGFKFHAILSAKGCIVCHSPHATNYPYQLYTGTVSLCVSCHLRFKGKKTGHPISKHPLQGPRDPLHPQKRFTCVSCHNPHGGLYKSLLRAPSGMRLCARCHPYQ